MSTGLAAIIERAKREPHARFAVLAHHINVDLLREAFGGLRGDAAVGADGVTKEQYAEKLEENLADLHQRMKTGRYRHQPLLRRHVPKEGGKTRPIGLSCTEDKIVQSAISKVLTALFEPRFHVDSYGYRPGRSAHDALRTVDRMVVREGMAWILEADIQAYFDSIDRKMLMEMLRERIADESFVRLVGKCLHVGVLEGEEYSEPGTGTPQGSVLSSVLGNIYLHHVLDAWFENDVRPRMQGQVHLVRYADDFVLGFQRKEDADRVFKVLFQRMRKYGLTLHPQKTRLFQFGRPPTGGTGHGSTFDFLGFTILWSRTRTGGWTVSMHTRKARMRRAILALTEYCRCHRHDPVPKQRAALARRLQGHFNYFGVNGNMSALTELHTRARCIWRKWLNKRSQTSRMTWERFDRLFEALPLPAPSIKVQIWGAR